MLRHPRHWNPFWRFPVLCPSSALEFTENILSPDDRNGAKAVIIQRWLPNTFWSFAADARLTLPKVVRFSLLPPSAANLIVWPHFFFFLKMFCSSLNAVVPAACECNYSRGCVALSPIVRGVWGIPAPAGNLSLQLSDRLFDVAGASLTSPPPSSL